MVSYTNGACSSNSGDEFPPRTALSVVVSSIFEAGVGQERGRACTEKAAPLALFARKVASVDPVCRMGATVVSQKSLFPSETPRLPVPVPPDLSARAVQFLYAFEELPRRLVCMVVYNPVLHSQWHCNGVTRYV